MSAERLLDVRGVKVRFGGLVALNEVDLVVERGQVHGLIGPNGSGKTTLFNTISGFYRPLLGTIRFKSQDITGLRPDRVAWRGMARTFQNIKLFHQMTVEENVLLGRHVRTRCGLFGALARPRWVGEEETAARERVAHVLDLVGLADRRQEVAENLSYGQQRLVEIGRALAMDPDLILLDEPTAGLNDHEAAEFVRLVRSLRGLGHSVLLVEHDMRVVMGVCDLITVLDHGEKIAEGTASQVQNDPAVVAAYLGTGSESVAARKRDLLRAREVARA